MLMIMLYIVERRHVCFVVFVRPAVSFDDYYYLCIYVARMCDFFMRLFRWSTRGVQWVGKEGDTHISIELSVVFLVVTVSFVCFGEQISNDP